MSSGLIPVTIEILGTRKRYTQGKFVSVPRIGEWVEIDGEGYEVRMVIHLADSGEIIVRVRS